MSNWGLDKGYDLLIGCKLSLTYILKIGKGGFIWVFFNKKAKIAKEIHGAACGHMQMRHIGSERGTEFAG